MFYQQDYDLSRQKYHEYNAQFDSLYVPNHGEQPGLVRRLWAALLGSRDMRVKHTARGGNMQQIRIAGARGRPTGYKNTCPCLSQPGVQDRSCAIS